MADRELFLSSLDSHLNFIFVNLFVNCEDVIMLEIEFFCYINNVPIKRASDLKPSDSRRR